MEAPPPATRPINQQSDDIFLVRGGFVDDLWLIQPVKEPNQPNYHSSYSVQFLVVSSLVVPCQWQPAGLTRLTPCPTVSNFWNCRAAQQSWTPDWASSNRSLTSQCNFPKILMDPLFGKGLSWENWEIRKNFWCKFLFRTSWLRKKMTSSSPPPLSASELTSRCVRHNGSSRRDRRCLCRRSSWAPHLWEMRFFLCFLRFLLCFLLGFLLCFLHSTDSKPPTWLGFHPNVKDQMFDSAPSVDFLIKSDHL